LELLEAKSARTDSDQSDLQWYNLQVAFMVIVAFNAGKWTEQDCPATAVARALWLTPSQVKSACNRDNRRDWLDIWRVTLEKLSALVAERGGRPIVENGHSMLEMPAATDVLRNNRDILEQLYSEVPQQLKDRHHMLPDLVDALCC